MPFERYRTALKSRLRLFGLATLAATFVSSCGGGSDLLLPGTGEPASITILQGNGQNGRVGDALPQPLVAVVKDGDGRPVQGATVVFLLSDAAPGASIDPDTTTTAADGTVTAQVVLGTRPGTQAGEIRAFGSGQDPTATTQFSLNAVSENASGISAVSGMDQSGLVGTTLPEPLVVQVADAFGNPIPGVEVVWTPDGGGTTSSSTTVTGDDGLTSVTRTLGTTAGTQRTLASVEGLVGSPVTFVHTATAGAATGVTIVSGDDQTGPVSTELTLPLVVSVKDGGGNPVPNVAVSWVIGAGGGSVSPSTSTTDANGQAVAAWTLGPTPGPNTVSAVVSGIGIVEFSATATAGAPARLSIFTQPSASAVSGVPLSEGPVIQLLDAGGNAAQQAGVPVTVSIGSGGGTLGGTLTRSTDGNGRAAFGGLVITGTPGTRTLRFTAPNFAAVTSGAINLTAAPTTTTITADDPDPSRQGTAVTVRFTVSSSAGTPTGTVQVSDGSDTCTGNLSGGQGSCSLVLNTLGGRTLTAAYAGGNGFSASSGTTGHTVNPPPTPVLTLATQPSTNATSGVPLNPQPVVQLRTGDGDVLTTPGVAVTATLQGGGALGGTVTVSTDGSGRAVFTDLVISGDAGTRTLTFTANGFASVTSATITLVPAPPDPNQSSVAASSPTVPATQPVTITVTVRDAAGNPLSGRSVVLSADGSDNTIVPGSQTTGGDGVASFQFSSTTAETKNISATADGVGVGSTQVTVQPVGTTTSINSTTPPGSAEAGTLILVSYAVAAATGTADGSVTVTSDLESTSCSGPLTGGVGQCELALAERGVHTLTATYAGTSTYGPSSGTAAYEIIAGGR